MGTILKRPFIIIYFALVALAFCTVSLYFPVLRTLIQLGTFNSSDILSSIVYLLQLVLKLVITPKGILILLALIIGVSLLAGLLFSGWLFIINNTLEHRKKIKAELFTGIARYFKRIFLMTLVSILICVLFTIFCLVASVPAIVITKAAFENKPAIFVSAVVIDIITVAVLFFAMMFFRIYLSFWYAAALNYDKKTFLIGKRRADSNFWFLLRSQLVFDIIFIIFTAVFIYADKFMGDDIILFIGKWIFTTIFPSLLIIYMFVLFKKSPDGGRN